MARVKRAVNAHKKRLTILERAARPARATSAACGFNGSTPPPGRAA